MPDSAAGEEPAAPQLVDDLVAGWLGGAVGILASNPFEVLVHQATLHIVPMYSHKLTV